MSNQQQNRASKSHVAVLQNELLEARSTIEFLRQMLADARERAHVATEQFIELATEVQRIQLKPVGSQAQRQQQEPMMDNAPDVQPPMVLQKNVDLQRELQESQAREQRALEQVRQLQVELEDARRELRP